LESGNYECVRPGAGEICRIQILMNAFKYVAPPYSGFAFVFDRMLMLFASVDSIRDTMAFPKTASAISLMDEYPSPQTEEQLKGRLLKKLWQVFITLSFSQISVI